MQQLNFQSDLEDEDADVETESVQKEDFFNLRQLFVAMKTDSDKDGKIGITKNRPIEIFIINCSHAIADSGEHKMSIRRISKSQF